MRFAWGDLVGDRWLKYCAGKQTSDDTLHAGLASLRL